MNFIQCKSGLSEIDFLDHRINAKHIRLLTERTDAIPSFPLHMTLHCNASGCVYHGNLENTAMYVILMG